MEEKVKEKKEDRSATGKRDNAYKTTMPVRIHPQSNKHVKSSDKCISEDQVCQMQLNKAKATKMKATRGAWPTTTLA